MRRRLHLHIGHPKCASSTLQEALALNVEALRDHGFLVADSNLRFPESGPQAADAARLLADACRRREAGLPQVLRRFHELGQQLGGRFDRAVVSAESLSMPRAEYLAKALCHVFEVHVVYYVRRQEDLLVSAWAQWGCKQGHGLVDYVEQQLKRGQPDYLEVLRRWQPWADHLHVRPLDPAALTGGDVVRDFFQAIDAGVDPVVPPRANPSLDLALLEVFASSPFLFASEHDRALVDWLRDRAPIRFEAEKATLGKALRERIHNRFEATNRELHARFFPAVDYEKVFGRRPVGGSPTIAQDTVDRVVDRMRRSIGLQFHLIRDLHRRVVRIEQDGKNQ